MATMVVRDAERRDEAGWLRMWLANRAHFGAAMSDADDGKLWGRIVDPIYPLHALVCSSPDFADPLIGFAHYVLHPHTFSVRMVCYLEDLWVEPAARGIGVGRRIIEALTERGRERGWRRLYWHTDASNAAARALYDQLARQTDHVRYEISLP